MKKALMREPLLRPRTVLLPQNAFCWRSADGATILPACTSGNRHLCNSCSRQTTALMEAYSLISPEDKPQACAGSCPYTVKKGLAKLGLSAFGARYNPPSMTTR